MTAAPTMPWRTGRSTSGAFVAIDLALREAGVRAPEIRAADIDSGLLLLEDLGSEGILDAAGAPILERYEAAIDLLVFMHGRVWPEELPLPDGGNYRLPPYDREALLIEISLFPDWFGAAAGEPAFPREAREEFLAAWSSVLDQVDDANNLGDARFPLAQHPLAGGGERHRSGRRPRFPGRADRPPRLRRRLAGAGRPRAADGGGRGAAQGALCRGPPCRGSALSTWRRSRRPMRSSPLQRATKVLGAFTRLALVEGKPGYQRHRERLKALLRRTLLHPVLSPLRLWYEPVSLRVRSESDGGAEDGRWFWRRASASACSRSPPTRRSRSSRWPARR